MVKYLFMRQSLIKKQNKVKELIELKEKSLFYVLIDLNKFPTGVLNNLRREIKKSGGLLKIYKKSLLLKSGLLDEDFKSNSPFGVIFVFEDDNKILSLINKIQKDKNIGSYILGYFKNNKYSNEFWKMIGDLPSKEALMIKLNYILKSLILRLILALKSPLGNFLKILTLKSSKAN